jgi:hypothetical protein
MRTLFLGLARWVLEIADLHIWYDPIKPVGRKFRDLNLPGILSGYLNVDIRVAGACLLLGHFSIL